MAAIAAMISSTPTSQGGPVKGACVMRCTHLAVAVIGLTLVAAPFAWAAQAAAPAPAAKTSTQPATAPSGTAAHAPNAQQQKMATCNKDAAAHHLAGAARKTFMSECLSSGSEAAEKTLTAQQTKMKTCNADATAKKLKGTERKTFMSSCLKGS
jgi:hypothetical protein